MESFEPVGLAVLAHPRRDRRHLFRSGQIRAVAGLCGQAGDCDLASDGHRLRDASFARTSDVAGHHGRRIYSQCDDGHAPDRGRRRLGQHIGGCRWRTPASTVRGI